LSDYGIPKVWRDDPSVLEFQKEVGLDTYAARGCKVLSGESLTWLHNLTGQFCQTKKYQNWQFVAKYITTVVLLQVTKGACNPNLSVAFTNACAAIISSLAPTRFCSIRESSTMNVWSVWNVIIIESIKGISCSCRL